MSFNFVQENFHIGQASPDLSPQFIFYKQGFRLGGGNVEPTWRDIILHGNTALTLVNAKADSLEYLKLFGDTEQLPETYLDTVVLSGGCEQNGTPTPSQPLDIISNNGAIKVRNKSGLPLGYTLLDYIESSGTQYIKTGIKPASGYKVRCKYIKKSTSAAIAPFGCTSSAYPNNALNGIYRIHGSGTNRLAYGNGNNTTLNIGGYDSSDTVYDVICNAGVWTINGTEVGTITSATWSAAFDIWLFARNSGGSVGLASSWQIMLCQIWDENGNLVFDCLPCKNSSNALGMYDLVSQTFLTNQGTGDFTAGNTVSDPIEIYTDGTQEVVTDSVGNTASAERLLAVGDYKDTQEVLTGTVSRNVGILVLDGSENWSASSTYNGSTYTLPPSGYINNEPLLCTHFVSATQPTADYARGKCLMNGNNLSLWYSDDKTTAVADIKQYLADQYNAGTPVIVLYPKSSATTETVTGQFLSKSPVTQTAGSISNLPIAITESSHTVPTPTQPLQINCNNGVIKYGAIGKNLFDKEQTYIPAFVNANTGELTEATSNQKSFVVSCLPNTTYTLSGMTAASGWGSFTSSAIGTTATSFIAGNGTITTGANDKYLIGLAYVGSGASYDYRNTLQIELGSTATAYEPYQAGIYTDGTTETVQITGKNLFDKTDTANIGGWYTDSSLTILESVTANRTYVMRCQPNTTYYIKHCTGQGGARLFYTEVEDWTIGSVCSQTAGTASSVANTVYSVTTSANAKWLFVNYGRSNLTPTFEEQANDFMLSTVELTTSTTYEPYYNGGNATAENLFKVGTYQDVQSVIDGGVTRNVRVLVLDGTEDWRENGDSGQNNYRFTCNLTDTASGDMSVGLCTHMDKIIQSNTTVQSDRPCIRFSGAGTNIHWYETDNTTTLEQFKAFLAQQYANGTPVIILYPLQTPITETVTAQPLTIQAGTNIVQITQASMDDLELEVKYKAGVSVTITEIQNAQLDDNVEVTING